MFHYIVENGAYTIALCPLQMGFGISERMVNSYNRFGNKVDQKCLVLIVRVRGALAVLWFI